MKDLRFRHATINAQDPVIRNSKKYETQNSKGRIDYWCICKNYSFAIELKHSYDNYSSGITKDETLRRWKIMNHYQLRSIDKDLMTFDERTMGIIPLALHFIISESSEYPTKQEKIEYISQEREMLLRIHNKLKRISEPNFISLWEIDNDMYDGYQSNGYSYPGLILVSKFYNLIYHKGSKRK